MVRKLGIVISAAAVAACNVSPPAPGTGGVDSGKADGASASCPGHVSVVCTDFMSTNIAIAAADGTSQSGSFVSTGSTTPMLSVALSGDVVVPFLAPPSGRVVLLDRFGTNVITWMDLAKASVLAQLPVSTGFSGANPQDYVEVDARRAFISRYGTNPSPGKQMYDQGGDVLVVDTTKYSITGRIAMAEENPALQPCPSAMGWLGSDVAVTLSRFSMDYSMEGDGRFVGVSPSTDSVAWTVDIKGLQNCGRVVVSPSGKVAAIACSSMEDATTSMYDPSKSDIVLYDATKSPPVETKRLGLGVMFGSGLQPEVVFAAEDTLVGLTYGGNATAGDTVFAVDTSTGKVTMLGSSATAFSLGGLRCSPGCGDDCLLGDSAKSVLRRWHVSSGAFSQLSDVNVDPTVGLPPTLIGGLM
jgi:hypothetical protein